ncbi:MAG TPA: glutaminyl-peptide cyclotransferase [Pseudonocardia sp.]|nr:glutaminyl-peptide cyclotransferase [Pseudonocardia sp.]
MPPLVTRALVTVLLTGALTGCLPTGSDDAGAPVAAITAGLAGGVPRLHPEILGTLPHDSTAWTEGLELDDGVLYESTGLVGHSELRELDPATGVLRRARPLPADLYGEGVTVLGPRIWQLTYRDGVALEWGSGPAPIRRVPWTGEGWGLCHTGDGRVVASDGTDRLRILSGTDLAPLSTVSVRIGGRPLTGLNELECTPDGVWANVYETDWLVRIDPVSGAVTAAVDATGLLPADQRAGTDVLNGIAALPGTDEFLLTGKFWPTLFRVRFVR